MIDGTTSKRRWRNRIKVEVGGRTDISWVLSVCQGLLQLLSYTVISHDLVTEQQLFLVSVGDWFQDLWPIDAKIHKCLWYPFLYIVSFKYDNPRSVIFLLLQKRKLWLREVEQFAQSHTASKVGVEIKKPSLLDTGMLPSLPHHTYPLPLRWMKLTLGRVGDMFVEWGPSWRHSWRCMLLFNPNTHSWDPLYPSKLILPKYHSKPVKSPRLPQICAEFQGAGISPRLLWFDHGRPELAESLLYPLSTWGLYLQFYNVAFSQSTSICGRLYRGFF